MNDQRPTRCPCSADSRRKAGWAGFVSRSFRKAETGVSQSSMNVWVTGIRLCSPASARASSTPGATSSCSAATVKQHLLGVREREPPGPQEDGQVVEDVGGLLGDPLVRLLAGGADDLLGLLPDLLAREGGVFEQLGGVRAGRIGRGLPL